MSKILLPFIDKGHGGRVVDIKGEVYYTTAPRKMYKHNDGSVAEEGIINREVGDELISLLKADNRPYVDLTATNLDLDLDIRVDYANDLYRDYKSKYNCLYLAIHANAGNGTGFEVWTSIGQTRSDAFAEIMGEELIREFPDIRFRSDKSKDGDLDKESKFYVLVNTKMPAVLGELLFFDNDNDWKLMQTQEYKERAAMALYKFLKRAETELNY